MPFEDDIISELRSMSQMSTSCHKELADLTVGERHRPRNRDASATQLHEGVGGQTFIGDFTANAIRDKQAKAHTEGRRKAHNTKKQKRRNPILHYSVSTNERRPTTNENVDSNDNSSDNVDIQDKTPQRQRRP